jgi:transcriptional regulator with XRE-family HTH domain
MAAAARRKAGQVDALIGRNVQRLREELGATQDDLVQALRLSGWQASSATVMPLERGERALGFEEVLILADVFNVPVAKLLAGADNETVQVGWLYPGGASQVSNRLTRSPHSTRSKTWQKLQQGRKVIRIDTGGYFELVREADTYAAERLGVSADDVGRRARVLWGRTLTDERDARTEKRVAPDASPRSRAIVRGHVSRELLAELEGEGEGLTDG